MPEHLFISYSRADSEFKNALVSQLEQLNIPVWSDDKIEYGENWEREIFQSIKLCFVFLVIMSPDSHASEWVQRECQAAATFKKVQIPLLLKGDVFPRFGITQYVDVSDGQLPEDEFYAHLFRLREQYSHSLSYAETSLHANQQSVSANASWAKRENGCLRLLLIPLFVAIVGGLVTTWPNLVELLSSNKQEPDLATNATANPQTDVSDSNIVDAAPVTTQNIPTEIQVLQEPEIIEIFGHLFVDIMPNSLNDIQSVDRFWITVYEINNSQFVSYLNGRNRPSSMITEQEQASIADFDSLDFQMTLSNVWSVDEGLDFAPVAEVTWYGAREYCEFLGFRLPNLQELQLASRLKHISHNFEGSPVLETNEWTSSFMNDGTTVSIADFRWSSEGNLTSETVREGTPSSTSENRFFRCVRTN